MGAKVQGAEYLPATGKNESGILPAQVGKGEA